MSFLNETLTSMSWHPEDEAETHEEALPPSIHLSPKDQPASWRESLSPKHLALPLLAIIIILSNSFLIAVIATHQRLRNVPGMFLISIAIADLMSGFPTIPLHVAAELTTNQPSWFCLIAMSFSAFQLLVTVLTLFVHIIERYIFLAHPLKHKKYARRRNALALIALVWVYSFVFGCLPLFGWNSMDTYETHMHYNNLKHNETSWNASDYHVDPKAEELLMSLPSCRFDVIHRGSYLGVLFYMHIVPIVIIVPACYVHILCQARTVLKRREPSLRAAITTYTFVGSARARLLSTRSNSNSDSGCHNSRLSVNGSPVVMNGSHINGTSTRHLTSNSANANVLPPVRRYSATLPPTNPTHNQNLRTTELSPPCPPNRAISADAIPSPKVRSPRGSRLSLGNIGRRLSSSQDGGSPLGGRALRVHHRPHLKPFFLLFIVLLCFILSWIPTMIWHAILFKGFSVEYASDWDFVQHPLPVSFYYAGVIFGVMNSIINPVLFGLGNPQVRQALFRVMCFCKRKKNTYRITRV